MEMVILEEQGLVEDGSLILDQSITTIPLMLILLPLVMIIMLQTTVLQTVVQAVVQMINN